jgi:hypothetical protein
MPPMRDALREIVQRCFELAGPLRSSIVRLEGPAHFSAAPLTALYFGTGQNIDFLEQLFFASPRRTPLASFKSPLPLRIRRASHSPQVDLVLGDLPPVWQALLPGGDALRLPAWVSQFLELPESGAALPRKLEREVGRLRRQRGYRVEFSGDEDDMRRFYREFYLPYSRSRFGQNAVVIPEARMIARLRGNLLAKLYENDRWVLGLTLEQHGRVLRFGWFGSAQDPLPVGASETLDWFCIQHARDSRASKVIIGSSRPSLNDGVVRYKLKFGTRFGATRLPPAQLAIRARAGSAAVLECIRRQSLIRMQHGQAFVYRVEPDARIVLKPLTADTG